MVPDRRRGAAAGGAGVGLGGRTMNQCRGRNRGFLMFGMSLDIHTASGNRLAARSLGPRQQALRWPSFFPALAVMARRARPTTQPAHPQRAPAKKTKEQTTPKCELLARLTYEFRRARPPIMSGCPAGVCARKPGPAAQSGSAAGSIPCFAASDAPVGGLTQPKGPPTHSHKDQGRSAGPVLPSCCHSHSPTSPSFLPLVSVPFQPTQLLLSTLHSLLSLVDDCVFSRQETPSQVACKRISAVQGPLPLVSASITNAQKPTTDCQNIATKPDPDPIP
jgi:hypothetical protein